MSESIKSVGDISKSVLAALGLASAAIGGMAGFLAFYLNFQKELEAWDQIKKTHQQHLEDGSVTIHNHKQLSDGDAVGIYEALKTLEPTLDSDVLATKWDENEVFVTYGDLEYEFAKIGLVVGPGRDDQDALAMVIRDDEEFEKVVRFGSPIKLSHDNPGGSTIYVFSGDHWPDSYIKNSNGDTLGSALLLRDDNVASREKFKVFRIESTQ